MRVIVPLAALFLLAASAQAQEPTAPVTPAPQGVTPGEMNTPPAGTTEPAPGAKPHRHRMSMDQRFQAANTTHDGHLTPEQAQAHWPSVAKHFSEIDADNDGSVTLDEIRAYRKTHRHHRKGTTSTTGSTSTQQ